jgi:hypothetical protein
LKLFAFTLDLEPEYAGNTYQYEIFKDTASIEKFLSVMDSIGVKITVFTVGEIFERFPNIIKIFEKYNCEFEVHSYSHDLKNPDSEEEIEKSKTAYLAYFNKYPRGYRAPQGRITESGIEILGENEFLYDSSIFPSYYPNPFKYLFSKRHIHYHDNSKIMEIPLTSISPFRLTLSISYIKLLGVDFIIKLSKLFKLPDVICFDSHLHDFIFKKEAYNRLPLVWKLVFARNKLRGTEYCVKFLEYISQQDYQFCYMSEIYDLYKKKLS